LPRTRASAGRVGIAERHDAALPVLLASCNYTPSRPVAASSLVQHCRVTATARRSQCVLWRAAWREASAAMRVAASSAPNGQSQFQDSHRAGCPGCGSFCSLKDDRAAPAMTELAKRRPRGPKRAWCNQKHAGTRPEPIYTAIWRTRAIHSGTYATGGWAPCSRVFHVAEGLRRPGGTYVVCTDTSW
jgi:hypothetical protein